MLNMRAKVDSVLMTLICLIIDEDCRRAGLLDRRNFSTKGKTPANTANGQAQAEALPDKQCSVM